MIEKQSAANVIYIGNDIFRFDLPPKTTAMAAFEKLGSHKLSIVLDKSEKYPIAVQGTRENLLAWLKSLGITDEAFESFEEALQK